MLRGGSWNNNARNCRSANRNNNDPGNRNNNAGFRLAAHDTAGKAGIRAFRDDRTDALVVSRCLTGSGAKRRTKMGSAATAGRSSERDSKAAAALSQYFVSI